MTDTPEPITDEVPRTLSALNSKVDQVVANGTAAIGEVTRLVNARDRLRTVALFLGVASLLSNAVVGYVVHQRCEDINEQNKKEKATWAFVVTLSANSPSLQTPEQRAAQVKALTKFLGDTYAPHDCWF